MTKKLSDEDGRIVDLLLDESRDEIRKTKMFVKPAEISPARVATVEKVLSRLQNMPVENPPAGLVARTIQRIEAASRISENDRESSNGSEGEQRPLY